MVGPGTQPDHRDDSKTHPGLEPLPNTLVTFENHDHPGRGRRIETFQLRFVHGRAKCNAFGLRVRSSVPQFRAGHV
uniref:Uncharacterized protein n=1 Tax=Romanomermis culicivorax TaxID=13658 RepID=A0A915KEA3_ROMCU